MAANRLDNSLRFFALLACFAPSKTVQAVSPPPDGGYPGGNTAEGQNALLSLTAGAYNTVVGYFSLRSHDTGGFNTGVCAGTLFANTGGQNTAIGAAALLSNTTGNQNVAVGMGALSNLSGNNNIAIGFSAGSVPSIGDNNIYIGNGGVSIMGFEGNTIRIGSNQQATFIAGINGTNVMGQSVFVDPNGRLGVTMSSERFKDDIKPMSSTSNSLLAPKPVTFRYKSDKTSTPQFGLIAEDVEKVNPDLVVRDKEGKPYSVRYEQVNAMLLNEFLKEHGKVQELEATIAKQQKNFQAIATQQQKQIEKLTAGLQKVSEQLGASKPTPRVSQMFSSAAALTRSDLSVAPLALSTG